MQGLARRKLPSIGLLALAVGTSALFVALGMWQLDRAGHKRDILLEFESRGIAAQIDLNQSIARDDSALSGYRATATGRYVGPNILLDNQLLRGRVGYLVYTAFELDERSQSILVNRGWIGAEADRHQPPQIGTSSASQRLKGRLSRPPTPGLRLRGSDLIERLADDSWRVQGIDFAQLGASLGEDILFVTLQLEEDATGAFVRSRNSPAIDEARHRGYAFQWFAMAVTVVAIAAVILLAKDKAGIP
jgi:surfeit locus 1 family protein